MATKDDRPGLLSKVAMFVRNPTKDWSELDRAEPEQESGYDKQALKAMIERKRQNDFVRKREFDQLRKLRNRDPSAAAGLARPSFFQTSIPTDPDGRAVTLKKIDEIEAQMSKQWWKGKQDAAAAQANGGAAASDDGPSADLSLPMPQHPGSSAPTVPATLSSHFDATESSDLGSSPPSGQLSEYAPTEMGVGMPPPMSSHVPLHAVPRTRTPMPMPPVGQGLTGDENSDLSFSTSKLFAIEVDDMATDPELEEAAIRFANGDDGGAESGLLMALCGSALVPEVALSWAAALLDLYRATNNRERFDWAVVEFAQWWGAAIPSWESLPNAAQSAGTTSSAPLASGPGEAHVDAVWHSPSELTVQAMEDLRDAMSFQPPPWVIGWSHLTRIDAQAMPLLGGLFASLCDEPVSLCFSGADSLVQALRSITPSGDRGVDSSWWGVRLNALRAMEMLDEFELVALDYCVTYEVSPPAWEPARCTFELVHSGAAAGADGARDGGRGFENAATVPMGLDTPQTTGLELRGDVLGDATQALAGLDAAREEGGRIAVSCRHLIRVDFSAAGSILNWVAMRESEGCLVQFQDVHRLVAAFFNVIGINEHARVIPRAI
ncbi:STAS domain-containing protein [Rhodoferax saidenbachensis]|uniref:MlaB-like STAS domain-containing protein n=1 Tax=Rhodoferax saidenbachensis TaxID=1484693 RepID=A0ABU1ZK84_9BURK|nr:STAS domain-containing protein [Rhodoferax saidenbachensis]MDR7305961.1 hypothetical protein [Rhodoferax saidenbachensis]